MEQEKIKSFLESVEKFKKEHGLRGNKVFIKGIGFSATCSLKEFLDYNYDKDKDITSIGYKHNEKIIEFDANVIYIIIVKNKYEIVMYLDDSIE